MLDCSKNAADMLGAMGPVRWTGRSAGNGVRPVTSRPGAPIPSAPGAATRPAPDTGLGLGEPRQVLSVSPMFRADLTCGHAVGDQAEDVARATRMPAGT